MHSSYRYLLIPGILLAQRCSARGFGNAHSCQYPGLLLIDLHRYIQLHLDIAVPHMIQFTHLYSLIQHREFGIRRGSLNWLGLEAIAKEQVASLII